MDPRTCQVLPASKTINEDVLCRLSLKHFVVRFDIRQAGQFDDHGTSVWRVCWNITGTILASSGDDGCVKLWKANYLDNWKCVSTLRADGQMTPGPSAGAGQAAGVGLGKSGFTKLSMVSSQANWH